MVRDETKEFHVRTEVCYGCGACIMFCPHDVLTLDNGIVVAEEKDCTHCNLCVPSCPVFALEIRQRM
jgi:2-oxoglutarate ferredoxin oxidoreductase subunit delta